MNRIKQEDIDNFHNLYHQLIFLGHQRGRDFFSGHLESITSIEISILNMLDKYQNPVIKDLLEILKIPNSTLTNAINRLEKKKFISRQINPEDKRSYRLELTAEGKIAQKQHKEGELELSKMVLEPLTEDERTYFLRCMGKIVNRFSLNS